MKFFKGLFNIILNIGQFAKRIVRYCMKIMLNSFGFEGRNKKFHSEGWFAVILMLSISAGYLTRACLTKGKVPQSISHNKSK